MSLHPTISTPLVTTSSSATNLSPSPSLPVIICLHGGGTNTTIFNIQTIRLQRSLSTHFTFIFLDAPFASPPGPGVLPFFQGCGPFYRWYGHNTPSLSDSTKERIADRVRLVVEGKGEFESVGKREVVGVLGFSQGGKTAAGLVLEAQLGVPSPLHEIPGFQGFKFGVFMNSTSPPLVSASLTKEQKETKIKLPAIHVVGSEDPWRDEGVRLCEEAFGEEKRVLIELEGLGHRLPVEEEDNRRVIVEILRVWGQVKGEEGKALGAGR